MALHWSWLIVVVAALSTAASEPLDFCANFFPDRAERVSNNLGHEVQTETVVTASAEPQFGPERAANAHDLHLGCTDIAPGEGAFTGHTCQQPLIGSQFTYYTSNTVLPNTPDEIVYYHCIRVLDRSEDGTGILPVVTGGGVGESFVNMTLYGQMSQGMKWIVILYSHVETKPTTDPPLHV